MEKTVLQNGLTVLVNEIDTAQTVTLSYFINAGSYDESNYPNGIAHYIEHMMFKGTNNRNAQQINEDIDSVGGEMNAYTTYDKTKYYIIVPFDQWKVGLDVLSDMMWNHTFPEDEIERERTVILEEIKMYNDDPGSVAYDVLQKEMHQSQTERQSIIGTPETVGSVTKEKMVDFINEFYQPDNMVLVVTGNVKNDEVMDFINNYKITRNSNTKKKQTNFQADTLDSKTTVIKKDIEQSHVCWGLFGCSVNDSDYYILKVIASLLGGSMSSRLYKIIREERGLAYSVSVGYYGLADSGFFNGHVGLDKSKIEEVKDVIVEEFERLSKEDVSEAELKKSIAVATGKYLLGLDSPSAQNDNQGCFYLLGLPTDPQEYVANIKKVTSQDIKKASQKYFTLDNWQFVEVVPR